MTFLAVRDKGKFAWIEDFEAVLCALRAHPLCTDAFLASEADPDVFYPAVASGPPRNCSLFVQTCGSLQDTINLLIGFINKTQKLNRLKDFGEWVSPCLQALLSLFYRLMMSSVT